MAKTYSEEELIEKKESYFATKEELDVIRSNATLLKWEVLSKAYKLGKEIWGADFTIHRLASDMELPYTTAKRCLALDRATPKSWELLRKKKISAFKLAMVCMLKANGFQDEIVAEVIKHNLSTYNIKKFKPNNIKDIKKWKHEQVAKKGYSRKDAADRAIRNWIDRGKVFMLLPMSAYFKGNRESILDSLESLYETIGRYLKKNGR